MRKAKVKSLNYANIKAFDLFFMDYKTINFTKEQKSFVKKSKRLKNS